MKIAILHLSDIHFRSPDHPNPLLQRVDRIVAALRGLSEPRVDACFVAVTGDIAYSGDAREYEVALDFFSALRLALAEFSADLDRFVFVPGNHDCNFDAHDSVRAAIIRDTTRNPNTDIDLPRVAQCMKVQENYFGFMSLFHDDQSAETPSLYYERFFSLGSKTVSFRCFNTAWMSELKEKQGQLRLPTDLIQFDSTTHPDLDVALLHHPYNWFESNNARSLRNCVEAQADIVLTGHEHVHDRFRKDTLAGYAHEYIEGAVLQDGDTSDSGFSAVIIDFDCSKYQNASWTWSGDTYRMEGEPRWISFDGVRKRPLLNNTESFARQLHDLGTGFTHPRKDPLKLSDLFIYPDLVNVSATRSKPTNVLRDDTIGSRSLIDDDASATEILIVGSDRAGKSTLAKALYLGFQSKKLTPVLIDGSRLRQATNEDSIKELLATAVEQQYGRDLLEDWQQLPRGEKALIIDNLQDAKLNEARQAALLREIRPRFGQTVAFAHESYLLGQLAHATADLDSFISFPTFRLREMGHRLRGALVERWIGLDKDREADEIEFARQVDAMERQIRTLLGKNLLPSYPIFVLIILQTYEARQSLTTASGAYGYYYEALITAALHRQSKGIPLDTIYTLLSFIAYEMFVSEESELSQVMFTRSLAEYRTNHQVALSEDKIRGTLQNARIIVWDDYGSARFQYTYIYYYFVAKYLAENLHRAKKQQEIRDLLSRLMTSLYVEDNANVIIFFMYLTKDEETIMILGDHAASLYQDYGPCDFDKDVEFTNGLISELPTVQLVDGDTRRHKEEYRKALDAEGDIVDEELASQEEEDKIIDDAVRINEAFKTLQIMGQVLRNFPGSLPAEIKVSIARQSYLLGLRMCGFCYEVIKSNVEQLKGFFQDVLMESGVDQEDREEMANFVLYRLTEFIGLGMIKRISQSIGSEYLAETFAEVTDDRVPNAISMVDLSIKLDHFTQFPRREIVKVYNELHDNRFVSSIIRQMVAQHLYLFPVPRTVRQSVCDQLKIAISDPKMLTGEERKFR